MVRKCSLSCSQVPATVPCPEPRESGSYPHILICYYHSHIFKFATFSNCLYYDFVLHSGAEASIYI